MHDISGFVKQASLGKRLFEILGTDVSGSFDVNPLTRKAFPVSWSIESGDWWDDESTIIGKITRRCQNIEIENTLTGTPLILSVPEELKLGEIVERYVLRWNRHASSYVFRYNGSKLDLSRSLKENGINPDRDEHLEVGLDEYTLRPTILMEFEDDLQVS